MNVEERLRAARQLRVKNLAHNIPVLWYDFFSKPATPLNDAQPAGNFFSEVKWPTLIKH
jgi:hypothetical protein